MPLKFKSGSKDNTPTCQLSVVDYGYSLFLFIMAMIQVISAPFVVLHTIMPYVYKDSPFIMKHTKLLKPNDWDEENNFVIVGVPISVIYIYSILATHTILGIIWCVILTFNNLANFFGDIQFIQCACILHSRFEAINEQLSAIASNWNFKNEALFKKKTCRAFLSELSYGHKLSDSIEMYRYCYGQFCDMIDLINSIYQIHLLGTISSCFLKILFNIYFAIFGYVTRVNNSPNKRDKLIGSILWCIYYSLRFLTIVWVSDTTTKQAVATKTLITDINNRYLDRSTKEELRLFLSQITSRAIEFTAYDFFSLNTHLITSAIAAGTTYLVILIQIHSVKY
ncbi:gustatory receptor 68a-like [Daktulosphaira vitifoliae]|uniref:gustatory receptor 68a-like n=1 Tax=Daktulosphaira vitifoliae TaxID=58002 RepID=UPI0021AA4A61|nr:gustatory receptor 68a-like [Daktulosphaira vitifoliae]